MPVAEVLRPPVADDSAADKADYLEALTLKVDDRSCSIQDLIREIRRSGSVELPDRGSEISQSLAESAFAEIESRSQACGSGYVFSINPASIELRVNAERTSYLFLLLLSLCGTRAGPKNLSGPELFEEICRLAAARYFGNESDHVKGCRFGFPRRDMPRGFRDALDALGAQLGDGIPNLGAPNIRRQKDGDLDIVVWKDFPDRRRGKLIGFGQCAAGKNELEQKATSLQISDFLRLWFAEHPFVSPIRMFFVPWRIDEREHRAICIKGGLVFDRCRIAAMTSDLPAGVRSLSQT